MRRVRYALWPLLTDASAVLGSYFLDEQLGLLGKIGCAICLIGSVIIVLHAPPDKEVQSVEEILNLALQPGMSISDLSLHICCYNND